MRKIIPNKKIISIILVVTTITMPFALIPTDTAKAQALNTGDYVAGAAGAIGMLPLCKDKLNNAISSLFESSASSIISSQFSQQANGSLPSNIDASINGASGMSDSFYAQAQKELGTNTLESKLQSLGNEYSNIANSVQTNDPNANAKLKDIQKKIDIIKNATDSLNTNDTCLQSIGRLLIKILLQKITLSTVDWINHGFNGGPAFVQNPSQFFKDIARDQILEFGSEINNPTLYPFGQAFMQNQAEAFKNQFAVNAQYSLDSLIQSTTPQYTAQDFNNDFSQGGWDAWSYMTQIPANNPLGFQLMAANELQRRISESQQQTQNQLMESGGFLGDMRCVDPSTGKPNNITQADRKTSLDANQPDPCIASGSQWEYVTPGKLIATAATSALEYPNNNLLKASDLNDAIAAILDAVINHFTSQWQTNGFANLSSQGANGQLIFSSGYINSTPQAQKDFTPAQLTSSWLANNPNFNIRSDLTQALVDEQRTYVEKLQKQDEELMSTTDGRNYRENSNGSTNAAYSLIPAIYQLDYCVPGPHPGWEYDSQRVLSAVINNIVSPSEDELKNGFNKNALQQTANVLGQTIATTIAATLSSQNSSIGFISTLGPVAGIAATVLAKFLSGILGNLFDQSNELDNNIRTYYSAQLAAITGLNPADHVADYNMSADPRSINMENKQGVANVLYTVLNRYAKIMNETYEADGSMTADLAAVKQESDAEFNKLDGYKQMITQNQAKIAEMEGVITQLENIKSDIDGLNEKLKKKQFTDSSGMPLATDEDQNNAYEEALQPEIDAFARVSSKMVNENDIASVDSILKQITDERDYVYNQLLKGPHGCEHILQTEPQPHFQWPGGTPEFDSHLWSNFNVDSVQRMTYPSVFPIFYDYNKIPPGAAITINNPAESDSAVWSSYCTSNASSSDKSCGESSYMKTYMPDASMISPLGSTVKLLNGNSYEFGPGFLSFILFGNNPGEDTSYSVTDTLRGSHTETIRGCPGTNGVSFIVGCREGPERLKTSDLIHPGDNPGSKYRAVGAVEGTTNQKIEGDYYSGQFETTIGIY